MHYRLGQVVPPTTIVFVCEHGAAKSVIAASWCERLAAGAGLSIRALARGTNLEPELSPTAVAGLLADGIDVSVWRPQLVNQHELQSAWRVISFGPELSDARSEGAAVEIWDAVPAVADDYVRARDLIVGRLRELIERAERGDRLAGSKQTGRAQLSPLRAPS